MGDQLISQLRSNGARVFTIQAKLEKAIDLIVDAFAGEAPKNLDVSRGAEQRKVIRAQARSTLLQLVSMSKQVGREEAWAEQRRMIERQLDGKG